MSPVKNRVAAREVSGCADVDRNLSAIYRLVTCGSKMRSDILVSVPMKSTGRGKAMTPRFVLIGGFLGAGKSTTVARLARHYTGLGQKVGIVTNDQTTDLVDTHALRNQGFEVGEVAGACFCCNFNELTATVERLSSRELPDVIIAEPVGSCTDLVATVIRPVGQCLRISARRCALWSHSEAQSWVENPGR